MKCCIPANLKEQSPICLVNLIEIISEELRKKYFLYCDLWLSRLAKKEPVQVGRPYYDLTEMNFSIHLIASY